MTRKISLLFALILGVSLSTVSFAQDDSPSYQGLKFSSQPKHQSEIGIHAGHFMVVGDVLPRLGWGAGVHFRRAFDYAFSWRLDFNYGQARGLEPRNSGGVGSAASANNVLTDLGYGNGTDWFHNYKTDFYSLSIQGIWSLNSFNFKKQIKKMNWYILGGIGLDTYKAYYDALNGSTPYDFSSISAIRDLEISKDARKDAKKDLKDLLDGDYETRAEVATGRRSGDASERDEIQINAHADVGVGLSFRLSDKINLGIEHKATIVFGNEGDLLDGYRWRTPQDLTQYRDLVNYTSVRLNFNIGKGTERSQPLWWVSPMDLIAEDLAEVKARPELDMTDTDKDGVIDMIDQEKDSRADCPVDTRGILLDSDGDGVVDCDDNEPHSPPGYKVDTKGVASVPTPWVDEKGVNQIVETKLAEFKSTLPTPDPTDWFLPMIHFDLDKYALKNSEYSKLHHVATVMKQNPGIRVVANGHTDKLAGNCYNDVLSYNRANEAINYMVAKYGIGRDRFILNWGGENTNIVPANGSNLINRRVEFTVATSESDMGRPDCGVSNAGSGGSKYSGNKEAGY